MSESAWLIDRCGRRIDYARLSVTDRCDLRCVYCMGAGVRLLPRAQLLTLEEMARLGRVLSTLGVTRLRITGGEPLLRRNVLWLIERLGALPGLRELTLTTNGTRLARWAPALKAAGVSRINISLDSLRPERYRALTRNGELGEVLAGIAAAQAAGFIRLRLNSVIVPEVNDDEIGELVAFAVARELDIAFIEEMPLGAGTAACYSSAMIQTVLNQRFTLLPTPATGSGPARYWQVAGTTTRVGVIAPLSHAFCATCNRLRITAAGRLLLCLGHTDGVDLRRILRAYPTDDAPVAAAITAAVWRKPRGHAFDSSDQPVLSVAGG